MPPEAKANFSQTLLLIIFGLLCFIAGLLVITLREQPRVVQMDNGSVVVTDTLSNERPPSGAVKAAEADDRASSPGHQESSPDDQRATVPSMAAPSTAKEARAAPISALETKATAPLAAPSVPVAALPVPAALPPEDPEPQGNLLPEEGPLPRKLIIYFKVNSNDLADDTLRELDQLVDALKRRPSIPVRITGYTDAVGNLNYNFKVSEFRANIVKSFLVGRGLDPQRIESRGLGPANPIATNDTPDGRRLNRRVEVELVDEKL